MPFLAVVASSHSFERHVGRELGPVYTETRDQSVVSGITITAATEGYLAPRGSRIYSRRPVLVSVQSSTMAAAAYQPLQVLQYTAVAS